MRFVKQKTLFSLFIMIICTCIFHVPVSAVITSGAKHNFNKYLDDMPWLGLIANEVTFGPITISRVSIHEGDKLVLAAPGEILHGSLNYQIKSDSLDMMQRYHLIIGIKGKEAQECIAHSMGLWDSKGHAHFKLTTPMEAGIYEVRFLFVDDFKCSTAKNEWNSGQKTPNSHATIGVIIIE